MRAAVVLGAAVLACASCVELGDDEIYLPEFAGAGGAGGTVTLTEVQPLFTQACAFGGCHGGANVQADLSLEEGQSFVELLGPDGAGAPSKDSICKGAPRVVPGSPDDSCLWQLVDQGLMPPGNPLPQPQKDLVRRWIEDGALEK